MGGHLNRVEGAFKEEAESLRYRLKCLHCARFARRVERVARMNWGVWPGSAPVSAQKFRTCRRCRHSIYTSVTKPGVSQPSLDCTARVFDF